MSQSSEPSESSHSFIPVSLTEPPAQHAAFVAEALKRLQPFAERIAETHLYQRDGKLYLGVATKTFRCDFELVDALTELELHAYHEMGGIDLMSMPVPMVSMLPEIFDVEP